MTQKTFSNAQLLPEVVKMLNEGHTVTLPLKGYSMRPFLENGRDKALLIKVQHLKKCDQGIMCSSALWLSIAIVWCSVVMEISQTNIADRKMSALR